jgi:hypothetical protein
MILQKATDLRPSLRGYLPPQFDTGLPFQWALGQAVHTLAPKVKEHVLQPPGTVVTYRGRMRVWRDTGWRGRLASWLLQLGALAKTMFPETGEDVDFEMEHVVSTDADGGLTMTWTRSFHFKRVSRRFDALMRFRKDRGPVVDWIGGLGCLQVELCPMVEGGAIVVRSRPRMASRGPMEGPNSCEAEGMSARARVAGAQRNPENSGRDS